MGKRSKDAWKASQRKAAERKRLASAHRRAVLMGDTATAGKLLAELRALDGVKKPPREAPAVKYGVKPPDPPAPVRDAPGSGVDDWREEGK